MRWAEIKPITIELKLTNFTLASYFPPVVFLKSLQFSKEVHQVFAKMPGRNSIRYTEKPIVLRRSPRLRISTRLPKPEKTITTVISSSFSSSSAPVKPISERKSPRFSSHAGLAESVKTIDLRRSPRFIRRCDFSCPEPHQRKSAKIGVRSSVASMSAQDCPRYSLKECREKTKGELSYSNRGYGKSEDLSTGLRKSPRLNNRDESFVGPRRSSRLTNLRNADGCGNRLREVPKEAMLFNGVPRNSMNKHSRSGNDLKKSESCEGKSQSLRKCQRFRRQCNTVDACRGAISDKYDDAKGSQDVLKARVNESPTHNSCAKSGRRTDNINCKVAPVRGKRKRDDNGIRLNQGWTTEQEAALQRAYYAAKPTPHFWKMVSKLVPGKSAQECFDKVHSNHLTPQPRPRSRAKKMKISPLTISENELLRLDPNDRVLSRAKRKNHRFVQKTVRRLLQKNCQVDQDCEIDLFSILEPDLDTEELQPNVMFSTPDNLKKKTLLPQKWHGRSSVGKKPLSRFSISRSSESVLVSPPVLKQVKNRVLHEKYIDQLHCREAKRKAETARLKKSTIGEDTKEVQALKVDVIRAAKHALVSDARDAIDHFKHSRENERSSSQEEEDYYCHNEDDEDYEEDHPH